ncbi:AAA family ATPase [Qipengyuania zhejiangensis]|uniref:AAA family ATPase n=1 Tax=Qipengyuania zhejiangensis TaxID=3077782 RepID=UPI002D7963B3|nr:AAA family ATPase [Qipengyuania sp. Z2]
MPAPRRAALTGAPGAGKSTLLAALEGRGFSTIPEVARTILQAPGGMEMRAERPLDFADAMLQAQLAAWDSAGHTVLPVVLDRGFPDIAGFLQLEGLPIPAELDRVCRTLRIDGPVFRAPPWPAIYRQDDQRTQDWDAAVASDAAIRSAWKDYGYDLVDLPLVPVDPRAAFVAAELGRKPG